MINVLCDARPVTCHITGLLLVVLGSEVLISRHMNTHQRRKPVLPEVDQVWAALREKKSITLTIHNSVCAVLTSPLISSDHLLVTDYSRSRNKVH